MRITTLFAAALVGLASPALAASPDHVRVRLADLDLSSPAGAQVAIGRLARAASEICAGGASPAVTRMSDAYARCRTETLAAAAAQLRTPAAASALERVEPRTVLLARR